MTCVAMLKVYQNLFIVSRRLRFTDLVISRQAATSLSITEDGKKLNLLVDGEPERKYHSIWLRHNCQCPQCFSKASHMNMVHPSELATDIKVKSAQLKGKIYH